MNTREQPAHGLYLRRHPGTRDELIKMRSTGHANHQVEPTNSCSARCLHDLACHRRPWQDPRHLLGRCRPYSFRARLHHVKSAEITLLLAQFAAANVSMIACESSILERSRHERTFGHAIRWRTLRWALFDSSNEQPTKHFGTAFVVAGKYGNILMSAAHILNGRSASSIIFAPGYANGQAPYNLWHVHKAYTDSAWQANQSIDDDFCFLKVGANVQGRVGSLNLLTGAYPQTCHVIRYPDGLTSPVQATVQAVWYSGWHRLRFTCDGYPNGTSGSPWIIYGNSAFGLLGGYQQGGDTPSVSYSPYFSASVRNLYDAANRAFFNVPGGLLETQFKEIEAYSGPKGIKKRIERSPIIDEKNIPGFEVRYGALDGSADRADLGIVFMFTCIESTVRRLLGRRDVTGSLKSLVGDNRSSEVANLLHLAFQLPHVMIASRRRVPDLGKVMTGTPSDLG